MTLDLLITAFGLFLLVGGGDVMVRGSAALASRLGISPLVIGLTVVAFGTSAPELSVNVVAAFRGNSSMSFGNIFGSNMANIGLIVAVTAFFGPMKIQSIVVSREVPMMLLVTVVASTLGADSLWGDGVSLFGRGDGIVLLLLFSVFGYYTLRDLVRQRAGEAVDLPGVPDDIHEMGLPAAIALTAAGLTALGVGGAVTVHGAEGVARAMGVSETIIGLTLVAIGTSLPELVASDRRDHARATRHRDRQCRRFEHLQSRDRPRHHLGDTPGSGSDRRIAGHGRRDRTLDPALADLFERGAEDHPDGGRAAADRLSQLHDHPNAPAPVADAIAPGSPQGSWPPF